MRKSLVIATWSILGQIMNRIFGTGSGLYALATLDDLPNVNKTMQVGISVHSRHRLSLTESLGLQHLLNLQTVCSI